LRLDLLLGAQRGLLVLDGTGGVRDVGLAVAELLEPTPGSGLAHRHPDVGVLPLELLGHRLADGEDGARPVDE
jgi:hypothetical protein